MNTKIMALFFYIFFTKEFTSTVAITNTRVDEYDITEVLNDTINKVFQSVEPQNVSKLISSIVNLEQSKDKLPGYVYNFTWGDGSMTERSFYDLQLYKAVSNNTRIRYGFTDGKIQIYSSQLILNLRGIAQSLASDCQFDSLINLRNCTITAVKQSSKKRTSKLFEIDYEYDKIDIDIECNTAIRNIVVKNIKFFLPSVLLENMNNNQQFSLTLEEFYNTGSTKGIISKYPNFPEYENSKYHYFIGSVSFTLYYLKNLTIQGLWNLHSFNFTDNPLTYTLTMTNIRGRIALAYKYNKDGISAVPLNFTIETLLISLVQRDDHRSVRVAAQNYSVIETDTGNRFAGLHSAVIIELLEITIASKIMPSIEFERTMKARPTSDKPETEYATEQFITETSPQTKEQTTTKQLPVSRTVSKSVPTTTTTTFSPSTKTTTKSTPNTTIEPFNYDLLFNDVTIKLISQNKSYPEQFQCELLNNLKLSHKINAVLKGKGNEANETSIHFHANLSSVKVSVIKLNNTKEDDSSCQFQILIDQIIDVKSTPTLTTISTKRLFQNLEIKKRIDDVLRRMKEDKERIIQTVKPMICSSLDVCSQSMKSLNGFFLHFIDTVLKKCSLRKSTTEHTDTNLFTNASWKINGI